VNANVPDGTPIAFGSFLGYEMAYHLVTDYPTHLVRHRISIVDPKMPMGFAFPGEAPSDDWVAADTAPRNVNEYEAFRAPWVEGLLRRWKIGYWIYTTGIETSAPSILGQLTPDHGFDQVATWTFGTKPRTNTVTIFRVNLERVALDRSRLYISPEALARLVDRLEAAPAASRPAARDLLAKIVVFPPSAVADADIARLAALAGP
jgi:hypothetical protein